MGHGPARSRATFDRRGASRLTVAQFGGPARSGGSRRRGSGEEDCRAEVAVTDEQIVAVRQEAERSGKTDEVWRLHAISRDTFYR